MATQGLEFRSSVLRFYVDQVDKELDSLLAGSATEVSIHPEDLLLLLRGRLSRCEGDSSFRLLSLMADLQRLSIRFSPRTLTEEKLQRRREEEQIIANSVAFAIWAESNPSLYDDLELLSRRNSVTDRTWHADRPS